ncbi:hypothetical protein VN97_g4108 [Penicillium thymicola]|uniref:Uncharacterized protein n=1 Tax=Penicillium thymicola TaxID=293382 RepID=A0AAI9X9X4_PENTH|nr:hypothetical protein VN97_g4108 [Penicillium thymicola]
MSHSPDSHCCLFAHSARPAGPMARRLTTNQEIAGSIPASVNNFLLLVCQTENFFVGSTGPSPSEFGIADSRVLHTEYGCLGIRINRFRIATSASCFMALDINLRFMYFHFTKGGVVRSTEYFVAHSKRIGL